MMVTIASKTKVTAGLIVFMITFMTQVLKNSIAHPAFWLEVWQNLHWQKIRKESFGLVLRYNEWSDLQKSLSFSLYYQQNKNSKQKTNSIDITLTFENFIKVTTSNYSYTKLELLAEIGGYVGLFLGISVLNLSDVLDFILRRFLKQDWKGIQTTRPADI